MLYSVPIGIVLIPIIVHVTIYVIGCSINSIYLCHACLVYESHRSYMGSKNKIFSFKCLLIYSRAPVAFKYYLYSFDNMYH